jgi:glutathione S-transferase
MSKIYKLYGWECSPYTCKVRSFLRYKKLPFQDIHPSFWTIKKVIEKRIGFFVMPVVVTSTHEILQDSSDIIDTIEKQHPENSIIPKGITQQIASLLLELHADEWIPMLHLHTRWNNPINQSFIIDDFAKNAFPYLPRFIAKKLVASKAKQMRSYLPILGVTPTMIPAVEAWGEEMLDALEIHFTDYHYLLGGQPSIGDFSFYGPLYAHLWRDPGSRSMITSRPHVNAWMQRMKNPSEHSFSSFLPNDQVPATLDPIFKRLFQDQFPVLQQTVTTVQSWIQDHPHATKLPRKIGRVKFSIGHTQGERTLITFPHWMLQRSLLLYQSLDSDQREHVDQFLERVGGLHAMSISIKHPLRRSHYRVVP